ncbi:MAG: hypothetical protein H0V15_01880 [Solirubrobacterales bacterium]|nr:hypothetical protein [Solirubrobacterales bacterium]
MNRSSPTLALLFACALIAGCGGGGDEEDLAVEDDVRNCLTEAGLEIEPAGLSPNPGLGSAAPDFRALGEDGVTIDVVVFGSAEKAERAAVDVRSALAGFGAADVEVLFDRNALAVFDKAPAEADREAVEACLRA